MNTTVTIQSKPGTQSQGMPEISPTAIWDRKVIDTQHALKLENLDGWLLVAIDSNPHARRILEINGGHTTRPFMVYISQSGSVSIIASKVEPSSIAQFPESWKESVSWYSSHSELLNALASVVGGKKIAAETSPQREISSLDMLPKGLCDLITCTGAKIHSSLHLLNYVGARWSADQIKVNQEMTAPSLNEILNTTFAHIREKLDSKQQINEAQVRDFMEQQLREKNLVSDGRPICAVNKNSSNPHYSIPSHGGSEIQEGDWVLLDVWGKPAPGRFVTPTYGDLTRVGYVDQEVPHEYLDAFETVRRAQVETIDFIQERLIKNVAVTGAEAHRVAVRALLENGKYQREHILHRTGHSMGTDNHFCGVCLDDFESRDTRKIIPGVAFSVEPGLYLDKFGVRLETYCCVSPQNELLVLGGLQDKVVLI